MDRLLSASSRAAALALQHPRTAGRVYEYGTAGFRTLGAVLDSTVLRCGMLAALRARTVGTRADGRRLAVGAMVTASHNPAEDNGVKLCDPDGGMMEHRWEELASRLANAEESRVCEVLASIAESTGVRWDSDAEVFVGRDTRDSSPHLAALLTQGAEALGARVHSLGEVTTPQLHYAVLQHNRMQPGSVADYYRDIAAAFVEALGERKQLAPTVVDCAHGVGANSVQGFAAHLSQVLPMEVRNAGGPGTAAKLNHDCGAEHVQKTKRVPEGVDAVRDGAKKCASIDGDADRLVYFYFDEHHNLRLIDGDKIIALATGFLLELLQQAGVASRLGVVQTAYANGASTNYIERLGVPVACVPTGVKHLHHRALDFDIGVYFEANGHGTVLFRPEALAAFAAARDDASRTPEARKAADRLLGLSRLINQAVGDALSDLLLVELILALRGWSLADWDRLYTDLPSRQDKVRVKDRRAVQTTDAERRTTAPHGLQERVDALVKGAGPNARAFVRPSGTEDVVRIYAEAATQAAADQLARDVGQAVVALVGQ